MNPTVNTNASTNGRSRRSLSDSIGKLDEMIDGLSQAIPDTIRDELRASIGQAVAEGVRTALIDIFASADVQAVLHGMAAPAPAPIAVAVPAPAPNGMRRLLDRVRQAVVTAGKWTAGVACAAAVGVADRSRHVGRWVKSVMPWLSHFRRPLAVGLGVGVAVTVIAAVAPGWVGATLSGIGAACTVVAVHIGLWVRRMFGLSPQTT